MTDYERLVAKSQKVLCVEEITKRTSYYNCFGDKIDEDTKITSSFYTFKEDKACWVKGDTE